ncbi:MAG TPA: 8-oxo-dGTP diphosphatase [Candidatus Binatia bacterium]|jgi:8-oxo-dGTP diphosphatase/2-hydroxy-dATP diphosphatase|nr:8-oxo-dGTP diphosphatase [Candidatus Binatia bacterium]
MNTSIEPRKKVLTLCLVTDGGRVLLGMKKRGFGAGRWNGFGGKVEAGETIEAAARRELREESGIEVPSLAGIGTLTFAFEEDPTVMEVHVFRADAFTGDPVETEEMRPQWFAFADIPFDAMWPDDRFWLPHALAGRRVRGHFVFEGENTIISHELEVEDAERAAA